MTDDKTTSSKQSRRLTEIKRPRDETAATSDANDSANPVNNMRKKTKHKKRKKKSRSSIQSPEKLEEARNKSIQEAMEYLSAWKERQNNSTAWKFKKTIQSWLIDHCLDVSHCNKYMFALYLEYIKTIQGQALARIVNKTKLALNDEKVENKQIEESDGTITLTASTSADDPRDEVADIALKAGQDKRRKRAGKILKVLRTMDNLTL